MRERRRTGRGQTDCQDQREDLLERRETGLISELSNCLAETVQLGF
jgi:hypothetical protein